MRNRARRLPTGRAPGSDGKPYEYIKFGPEELLEYVLSAANAFLSRSHPLPMEWLGALLSLAPKSPGAVTMKGLRPLSNIITSYKFCTAEVTDRMLRTFEEYGVLQESQEGARRGRGAKRQVLKLQQIFDIAKRGKMKIAVTYFDFNIAFTGTNHECVYETAEATGVPRADIELLKSLDHGAWCQRVWGVRSMSSVAWLHARLPSQPSPVQFCGNEPPNYLPELYWQGLEDSAVLWLVRERNGGA